MMSNILHRTGCETVQEREKTTQKKKKKKQQQQLHVNMNS
jgi:hypothetical protein